MSFLQWLRFGNACLDVLRHERKRGESLIDCLNRIIAEAREWRKLGASKPEPSPQNQDGPALWPMIVSELGESELDRLLAADMLARHEFGVAKYGVPLVASNGRDHLADAYQEALDGVVCLRAAAINQINCTFTYTIYSEMMNIARCIRALLVARDGK